jgi:hypothetical protein
VGGILLLSIITCCGAVVDIHEIHNYLPFSSGGGSGAGGGGGGGCWGGGGREGFGGWGNNNSNFLFDFYYSQFLFSQASNPIVNHLVQRFIVGAQGTYL